MGVELKNISTGDLAKYLFEQCTQYKADFMEEIGKLFENSTERDDEYLETAKKIVTLDYENADCFISSFSHYIKSRTKNLQLYRD